MPVAKMVYKSLFRGAERLFGHLEGCSDRRGNEAVVGKGRQVGHPDTVRVSRRAVRRHLKSDTGLARAARADEGDHPPLEQQLADLAEFVAAADEGCCLDRQVVLSRLQCPWYREVLTESRSNELEQRLRAAEVLETIHAEVDRGHIRWGIFAQDRPRHL